MAIAQRYYWFRGMKTLIANIVKTCPVCIARKGRPLTKESMAPDYRPFFLGGRWHIDGLELPPSGNYDHLLEATDVATKYVILKPAKGETKNAAIGILADIIRRFGPPKEITTDRGRAFMSKLFMEACKGYFIEFKPVAVGQPQADGIVERVNRTITDIAAMLTKEEWKQWAKYVGEIEYAINTRVSSVTKHSPYELVFGRVPPNPNYIDILGPEGEKDRAEKEQLRTLRNRISVLQQIAHENQMEAAEQQRSYYEAHATAHTF